MKKNKIIRILYKLFYFLKYMCFYLSTSAISILLIPLLIELFVRIVSDVSVFGKYLTNAAAVIGIVFILGIIFSILEKLTRKSGRR